MAFGKCFVQCDFRYFFFLWLFLSVCSLSFSKFLALLFLVADESGIGHEHYLRCSQHPVAPLLWKLHFPLEYLSPVGHYHRNTDVSVVKQRSYSAENSRHPLQPFSCYITLQNLNIVYLSINTWKNVLLTWERNIFKNA